MSCKILVRTPIGTELSPIPVWNGRKPHSKALSDGLIRPDSSENFHQSAEHLVIERFRAGDRYLDGAEEIPVSFPYGCENRGSA